MATKKILKNSQCERAENFRRELMENKAKLALANQEYMQALRENNLERFEQAMRACARIENHIDVINAHMSGEMKKYKYNAIINQPTGSR